jgi:uncharacterized protein (DUF433 family)
MWRNRIERAPDVLAGKPVIRGTRLSVEFILELLGAGWTEADILGNYPSVSSDDIQACLLFAAAIVGDRRTWALTVPENAPAR